jgi:P-type Mg2+ transporter
MAPAPGSSNMSSIMRPELSEQFWLSSTDEILARLGASRGGLSSSQAGQRLVSFGHNLVLKPHRRRIFAKIARRLVEPLIAILVVAAAISGAAGDWVSFLIIVAILSLSIGLEIFQEHRAERAADALRQSVALRTRARRDGRVATILVEDVVPGDLVELAAGDFVPADGVVLASRAAHVNEALLTGEPYPAEKRPGPCDATMPADAFNALFGGTALVSGEATMLVVATGAHTRFGGIAAALEAEEPPTAFERGLHSLSLLILRLTAFLVLFVLLTHLAMGRPVIETFLFAVALAIGLTPELLPMVMTVTLSRGALRMAERKVIVKRLAAIHDLGAMDVLCTDKTGTLTEARIELVGHLGPDGKTCDHVLELATVNSRFESGVRSALDDAILAHSADSGFPGWQRISDVPFDFERRRVSVLAEKEGQRLLVVKGAPEEILARSTAVGTPPDMKTGLDDKRRTQLAALYDEKADEGLRSLAVAWRSMPPDRDRLSVDDEQDLVFAGYCVFADPPKVSAAHAIAQLEAAGVRVKIVSGDAAPVVQHLVKTLEIPAHGLLTGAEIAEMSDAELAGRAHRTDLFARVSPDQKTRIIRALQARGHTVAFLGDGINDAPAIKAADAGLSVDSATDVARAAADIILLAPDLGVLADGVAEGRRTYANIMKYVRMGTSSNFGNMLSMAFASLFIPFLPLTPIQVLLNNLLYDISETGIPFDATDAQEMRRPHTWDIAEVLRFTLIMGPLSSVFDLLTFAVLILGFGAGPDLFRTAWFMESMATQILVIFLIRTTAPAWTSRAHPVLVATSFGALATALFLPLSPLGGQLGFTGLPWTLVGVIAVLVVAYLGAAEFLKRLALAVRPAQRHRHLGTKGKRALPAEMRPKPESPPGRSAGAPPA